MAETSINVGLQWCKDCKKMNKAMDIYDQFSWECFGTIAFDNESQEILVNQDQLMRIIQIVNPMQEGRQIRLVNNKGMYGGK